MRKTQAVLITLSVIATLSFGTYTGLAAGDSAAGQKFFTTHCGACHATEPGVNKIGPSLAGVVGRKSLRTGFQLLTRAQGGKHHVG